MSKKVYIGVGHGGSDPGAVSKKFKEKDLTLAISKYCKAYLDDNGVFTKISRTVDETDTVNEKVREANAWGADLVLEIHINAGGGDGIEVYHSKNGGTGKTLAQNIINEAKKIGQNSRGIKTKLQDDGRDYFGMIRDTNAPAVLIECAFIDSKDIEIIDTAAEQKKFGEAIAKAAMTTLGVKPKATFKSYVAKVKASNLAIRAGAGTNYKTTGYIKDKGSYTIVAESTGTGSKKGWGKLKSGAGWISLDYVTKA